MRTKLLASILMVACCYADPLFIGTFQGPGYRAAAAVMPELVQNVLKQSQQGIIVTVVPQISWDRQPDAMEIALRYRTPDGVVLTRTQIALMNNPGSTFWIGRCEILSLSIRFIYWESQRESPMGRMSP